jgi:hypothetical protein
MFIAPRSTVGGERGIMYRDIQRDWQRWTATERLLGGLICAVALLGVPAAIILAQHP